MEKDKIFIISLGEIEDFSLIYLKETLEKIFPYPVILKKGNKSLDFAYDQKRGQYYSPFIMEKLKREVPQNAIKVLGVTEEDLFVKNLNFIFGQAEIFGEVSLISIKRLREEYYNKRKNDSIFLLRTLKEAVHELGHSFGLNHCKNSRCVMFFSNSIIDTDNKSYKFCSICEKIINRAFKSIN
ncbi:MAG: archaemetzincin family Zn-dependent metalloprotease [Acidobacteriota bacterium]